MLGNRLLPGLGLGGSRLGDQAVVDTNDDAQLSKLCVPGPGWRRPGPAAAAASARRRLPAAEPCPWPRALTAAPACAMATSKIPLCTTLCDVPRAARRSSTAVSAIRLAVSPWSRLVCFSPGAAAGTQIEHPCSTDHPPAGYYSRYAALRNLLLQFLALGVPQPGGNGGSGSGGSGNGGKATGGSHPQQSAQAAGSQAMQPSGQQQQQQQQQPVDPPPAAAGQAGAQQPSSASQEQAAAQQQQEQEAQPPLRRQVLVLGAGYDTAYFQLAAAGIRADKYVEVDFLQASWGAAVVAGGQQGQVPKRFSPQQDSPLLHPWIHRQCMCWPVNSSLSCPLCGPTMHNTLLLQVAQKKAAAIQQLPDLLDLVGGQEAASSISPGAVPGSGGEQCGSEAPCDEAAALCKAREPPCRLHSQPGCSSCSASERSHAMSCHAMIAHFAHSPAAPAYPSSRMQRRAGS